MSVLAVLIVTSTCLLLLLSCSSYIVEASTYLRLTSHYPNTLLYLGVILTQYFTAAAPSFGVTQDHLLPSVGGFALLCGSAFFLTHALLNSKIRNLMLCREDPITRSKTAGYSTSRMSSCANPQRSGSGSSTQSTPPPPHRSFLKKSKTKASAVDGSDHVWLGGGGQCGNHLSYMASVNPVLFSQVNQGRVGYSGGVGHRTKPNPLYQLDMSSSAV